MTLAELKPGTELPPLNVGPVTRRALALFAGGSGDHQPIHIDLDAALARGRPDVIAPGMMLMAHVGRLLTGWVPQERIRSCDCRFVAVTPAMAEPVCTARVATVEDGLATLELTVTLADGTVTLRGEATVDIS